MVALKGCAKQDDGGRLRTAEDDLEGISDGN